jgi:hypothetical protein
MKTKATTQKVSISSQNLVQIMRKIIIVYFISAAIVLVICFILGWRTLSLNWQLSSLINPIHRKSAA